MVPYVKDENGCHFSSVSGPKSSEASGQTSRGEWTNAGRSLPGFGHDSPGSRKTSDDSQEGQSGVMEARGEGETSLHQSCTDQ